MSRPTWPTTCSHGARFYVDHAHPSTRRPECADAIEALIHDRAGEECCGAR